MEPEAINQITTACPQYVLQLDGMQLHGLAIILFLLCVFILVFTIVWRTVDRW